MKVFPPLAFVPARERMPAGGAAHEVWREVDLVFLIWIIGLLFWELRPHEGVKLIGAAGAHATAHHAAAPTSAGQSGYVVLFGELL
jgi:hypothetical protein